MTAIASLGKRVRGKPGLRVRLKGLPGNPTGNGAQLRLVFGQRLGPAREIHAGSGYSSQDSAVQRLATPQTPTEIQVRWPGGKLTTNAIPQGAKEILEGENGLYQAATDGSFAAAHLFGYNVVRHKIAPANRHGNHIRGMTSSNQTAAPVL